MKTAVTSSLRPTARPTIRNTLSRSSNPTKLPTFTPTVIFPTSFPTSYPTIYANNATSKAKANMAAEIAIIVVVVFVVLLITSAIVPLYRRYKSNNKMKRMPRYSIATIFTTLSNPENEGMRRILFAKKEELSSSSPTKSPKKKFGYEELNDNDNRQDDMPH